MWTEFQYRRAMPGTSHADYLDEPAELVQWFIEFSKL